MEILDENCALLTNWEVYEHIHRQKYQRSQHNKRTKLNTKLYENASTIEFELLQYFKDLTANLPSIDPSILTKEKIVNFSKNFSSISLTKAEKLQLINLNPQSILELHLIVEECEERFNEEEMENILKAVSILLPLSMQHTAQSKADDQNFEGGIAGSELSKNDCMLDDLAPDLDDI